MKLIKRIFLIVVAILLMITLANFLFFPFSTSEIIQIANDSGEITDQTETKGSALFLVKEENSDDMKLLHYQKSPIFQRYRFAEEITFLPDSPKHYGFGDFFNAFSVEVASNSIIIE